MSNTGGRKATRQLMIGLVTCVSLSACAAPTKSSDAGANNAATQQRAKSASTAIIVRHRAAHEGKNYEWGKDHIFVKLSSAETGGALTLIQDNLKAGFDLGMHLHKTHTEIFYILDGEVAFTVGGKSFSATKGTVLYIPAGMPHAAKSSKGGKMLMFYAPGGFDEMLAEIDGASWFQRLNPFAGARRNEKYDIHKLPNDARPSEDGPQLRYLAPGKGKRIDAETGTSVIKLSSAETDGLATVIEASLKPGSERRQTQRGNQAQILYVLDGEVEFKNADKMDVAAAGATIYFPPGQLPEVKSLKGAKVLEFRTPGGN